MKPWKPVLTTKLKFIEPMYAKLVNELPEGKEWLYEVKFDGSRCLAGRDSTGVTLWSRRGSLFTNQFPHIEFTEWTPDGHLRHSRFVGLREDKEGREVVREGW